MVKPLWICVNDCITFIKWWPAYAEPFNYVLSYVEAENKFSACSIFFNPFGLWSCVSGCFSILWTDMWPTSNSSNLCQRVGQIFLCQHATPKSSRCDMASMFNKSKLQPLTIKEDIKCTSRISLIYRSLNPLQLVRIGFFFGRSQNAKWVHSSMYWLQNLSTKQFQVTIILFHCSMTISQISLMLKTTGWWIYFWIGNRLKWSGYWCDPVS